MRDDDEDAATAIERAARLWGEAGLQVRHEARLRGVVGALPYLNDLVQRKRGRAAPTQQVFLAREMVFALLPQDLAEQIAAETSRRIVAETYRAYGRRVTDRRLPRAA